LMAITVDSAVPSAMVESVAKATGANLARTVSLKV
jgi:hypothetical protein